MGRHVYFFREGCFSIIGLSNIACLFNPVGTSDQILIKI
jgi:hypothetical protein